MPANMTKHEATGFKFDMLQIEVDAILLSVVTARLVEKINRGFKYTIGDTIMKEAMSQGRLIRKGIKTFGAADKLKYFNAAAAALDALSYGVEVALCAGKVTAAEKATFDSQFIAVQSQLQAFAATQAKKVRDNAHNRQAKQGSDGSASEATSE